jgi:hypothetical protein
MVAAALLTLITAVGASAGQPDTVDPALMSPPLNPSFTWECWRAGDRIICDGERTTTYEAQEAPIPCDDGWVYATGIARDSLRRVGDAEGRALTTLGTTRIDDSLSLTPAFDGVVASAHSSWTDLYDYQVPGDLASRTVTRRGVELILTIPGEGNLVLDAGIKAWDIDDNLLFARGPHDLLDDIDGAVTRLCDALAGTAD